MVAAEEQPLQGEVGLHLSHPPEALISVPAYSTDTPSEAPLAAGLEGISPASQTMPPLAGASLPRRPWMTDLEHTRPSPTVCACGALHQPLCLPPPAHSLPGSSLPPQHPS